ALDALHARQIAVLVADVAVLVGRGVDPGGVVGGGVDGHDRVLHFWRSRTERVLASGVRSMRRRSWAMSATTTVDSDIRIAPTDIGSTNPTGARTPAASGTEMRLYPAAHHRFCFIFLYAAFDSWMTESTERGSELARMTPAEA